MISLISTRAPSRALPVRGAEAALWYARFFRDPVGALALAHRRFGNVLSIGNVTRLQGRERQHVFALGPEMNRLVLGDPESFQNSGQIWRGPKGSVLRRIRNGLTRMNGVKYVQQRQLMLPVFMNRAVERYVPEMSAITAQVIEEQWQVGQTVDMYQQMRDLALRLSSQILFGNENPEEAMSLARLGQEMLNRTFSLGVWGFPFDLPGTPYRRMCRTAERVERSLLEMIERRRTAPSQHCDLLQVLVRAFDEQSVPMDSADLIGQAAIMFAASYENVASVLTWASFLLAQHPEVMSELHEELRSTLHGQPPTIEDLNAMPLLDAVIKETMRIIPPVPFLARKVMTHVDLGPITVGPRDRLVCSPYVTHHLPELFPEPERFLPERWFDFKPGPYDYIPFGAGPRACIGKSFAVAEIKVALAMILSQFRLTVQPAARIDRTVQVMIRPKHGMPMSIHRQDGRFHAVNVRGDIHDMVTLSN